MNALETMALTEKNRRKSRFAKNNLVSRTMEAKKADKGRVDELRVELGVKEGFKKKLGRHMLIWAVHMENMGDEKLTYRDRRHWRVLIENLVGEK